MEREHLLRLAAVLALGLGLALGLLWAMGGGAAPVTAATAPQEVERPRSRPLQGPGDVYCVAPISQTYAGCTRVFTSVQYAVDAATGGEIIKVAEGAYTDVHLRAGITQIVYISETVTVQGGYTTADWTTADPVANPTTLDAQGQGRVIYITGDVSPTLEGLRITGGDATGLMSGGFGEDAGGGICIYEAAVTISNCLIYNNVASRVDEGHGGGVFILSNNVMLSDNTVISNTASIVDRGYGGGVSLRGLDTAILNGNTVVSNTASVASYGYGGGLYFYSSKAALGDNTVVSNIASTDGNGYGGGLYFIHGYSTTLNSNAVVSNTATLSPTAVGWGGGLRIYLSTPFTLTNNLVVDNHANTLGSGLVCGGFSPILASGRLLHNTIADNHGGGEGVSVRECATLAFTNTIVAGHSSVGIAVTAGGTATLEGTLWSNNGADTGGEGDIFTGTVNVYDDPAFVNPAVWDYHIGAGSAAIDQGVDADVTTDVDGETRPNGPGYDLGADEFYCYPLSGVGITGPLSGVTGITYTFTATVGPPMATRPITYTWVPQPEGGQGGAVATYTWATTGTQTITATAENCTLPPALAVSDTHTITITLPPTTWRYVYLPLLLRDD